MFNCDEVKQLKHLLTCHEPVHRRKNRMWSGRPQKELKNVCHLQDEIKKYGLRNAPEIDEIILHKSDDTVI